MRRAFAIWSALAALGVAVLLAALAIGSVAIHPGEWLHLLRGEALGTLPMDVVLKLRLPRAMTAFACGGLLALSGALLQALLRNPLADPYVLGISSGAGAGALLALWLGWQGGVELAAASGAVGAIALLFLLSGRVIAARPAHDATTPVRLILIGVMLASAFAAVTSLVLTLAPEAQLRGMIFWLLGDLAGASEPLLPWAALIAATAFALLMARDLNLLARGEFFAQSLGVEVRARRWQVMLLASLATAVAVTAAGTVGFVGLVVPHIVRTLWGNDQRVLLPASVLAGGAFLTFTDTVARSVAAPIELPVGVVTAFIGAPLFIGLLLRGRRA